MIKIIIYYNDRLQTKETITKHMLDFLTSLLFDVDWMMIKNIFCKN